MSRFSRSLCFVATIFIAAIASVSCSWRESERPSVLVIAVENLGFGSFACDEQPPSEEGPGFAAFCQESVRFLHAYSPSTMSQAVVGSLLTGLYPSEHGVRHNGPQALSASIDTIAEVAKRRDYKTSFFSGGPPIWRRAGFNQGFDLFDDSVPVGLHHIYRSASEVVSLFLNWQENEASQSKFLSFLYLSDLQFIDEPTINELGDVRESSYHSQLEAVSAALGSLVREMKKRKIWDSTDIFLVGLNGAVSELRSSEIPSLNLYSESTRTTLMIKPARTSHDPSRWTVDSNVSLVDVGATLFDFILPNQKIPKSEFETTSLRSVLKSATPEWSEDRDLISESAWGSWRLGGPIRSALRHGPYFFINDEDELLYDTTNDNLEVSPLNSKDRQTVALKANFRQRLHDYRDAQWTRPSDRDIAKWNLAKTFWRVQDPDRDVLSRLKNLSRRSPDDEDLLGWRAILALRRADWKELKDLSTQIKPHPTWAYVADRNLNLKAEVPADACFSFLNTKSKSSLNVRDCEDESARALISLSREQSETDKARLLDDFLKSYSARALLLKVEQANEVTGLRWDTSVALLKNPEPIELLLALPDMKKYRSLAHAHLNSLVH